MLSGSSNFSSEINKFVAQVPPAPAIQANYAYGGGYQILDGISFRTAQRRKGCRGSSVYSFSLCLHNNSWKFIILSFHIRNRDCPSGVALYEVEIPVRTFRPAILTNDGLMLVMLGHEKNRDYLYVFQSQTGVLVHKFIADTNLIRLLFLIQNSFFLFFVSFSSFVLFE